MNNLERTVEQAVLALRARLAAADIGSDFRLDIEAQGRIQGGDVRISYVLTGSSYGSDSTRGNRLEPVVDEFLRRKGWNQANEPLAIGCAEAPLVPPDEIF